MISPEQTQRAYQLAQAQVVDDEIAATLRAEAVLSRVDLDGVEPIQDPGPEELPGELAVQCEDMRSKGRTVAMEILYQLVRDGDPSCLQWFGRHYLGHDASKFDEQVRKHIKEMSRMSTPELQRAVEAFKLKLVGGT